MFPPVSAEDWAAMSNWWDTFRQDQQLILASPPIREMPDVVSERHWSTVDSFWNAFEVSHELLFTEQPVREMPDNSEADAWVTVDDFWDGYTEQHQDDLIELQELMLDLQEDWADGASQFDEDPLTTNWRSESQYEGPLRTTVNEEAWSQWLAHLLRMSSGPFVRELLGTPNRPPTNVRREVVFFGDDSKRRVDILVEYEDGGVSIEVKRGDENYGKTPETAALVERNDHRNWSHVLLLQNEKLPLLQQTFGDELKRPADGPPIIQSEQPDQLDWSVDIDVQYWRDVSCVLRRMLIEGREPDNHWEASAYIFITLIEQRVLGLHPFSFVGAATDSSDTVPPSDIHRLVVAEPDAQNDYLRAVLHEEHNHE